MKKRFTQLGIVLIAFISCTPIVHAYYYPGDATGFVNDYTGTLSSDQVSELNAKLTSFEQETGNEIAVAMIPSLDGDTIENFAVDLFSGWGIGKKGADNGVLILIAKEDRQMRIEVGYGLEGALTDAQSYWIINNTMKPAFQADDFYAGIDGAVDHIIAATEGEVLPSDTSPSSSKNWDAIFTFGFFAFMWLAAILGRSKSWWLGGVLGGIVGVIIGIIKGFIVIGFISIAVLIPLGLLFDFVVSKQYTKGKATGHVPWWIGGGHGGGRGGFGGGGSFGGFGGGMSGGGGSSGSW